MITDLYLMIAVLMERLLVSEWAAEKFDMQTYDLRKLNSTEFKEKYQVTIWSRFTALGSLDDNAGYQ
jgi:hypothetical protein